MAAFLALGVIGLVATDENIVRAAYLVMEPAAWVVLVPLALGSLVTGLLQSLGTSWGVFRHYWVVFKLLINLAATLLLLVYMETFSVMAAVAGDPRADLEAVRNFSPVLHAVAALVLLVTATTLAILKPRGLTWYGRRQLARSLSWFQSP